jgi:hypothetical protein
MQMQDFQLYIDDDRYTVVSLRLIEVSSAERALELAEKALAESSHHQGAELYHGDERLWSIGTLQREDRRPRHRASF